MSKFYSLQGQWILAHGNTFVVRENLKELGARWRSADKTWVLEHSAVNLEGLQKLGFFQKIRSEAVVADDPVALLEPLPLPVAGQTNLPSKIYSVKDINSLIGNIVQKLLPDSVWIEGEVSSFRLSKGHCYFDLSEIQNESESNRSSSLSCCLWQGRKTILSDKHGELPLAEGVKVRLQVRIEWRLEGGRISCVVEDLDPNFTEGALARERKAIVSELKKRGLYDANRQTKLPHFSMRLALITAEGSRAQSDFLDELKQSNMAFRVVLYNCTMQGNNTSRELSDALAHITKTCELYDSVVITRGGGSRLDLRWFDDLEISKAIGKCPLPVLSAIGHFDDVSVADEVSYVSLKTPTAAASYLAQRSAKHFRDLSQELEGRAQNTARRLVKLRALISVWKETMELSAKKRILKEQNIAADRESRLNIMRRQLMSPLQRGYTLMKKDLTPLESDPLKAQILSPAAFLESCPAEFWLQMWDKHSSQHVYSRLRVLQTKTFKE